MPLSEDHMKTKDQSIFPKVVVTGRIGQVLLIKACWGGKSLGHDFLAPPSAGRQDGLTRISHTAFEQHRNDGFSN